MIRPLEAPDPNSSVYTQPTPHGLWTDNPNFGASIPVVLEANARHRVLKLPEWGEPAVWTIALGIDYPEQLEPGLGAYDVIAEVTFGSGGGTETVLLDWLQGTAFSVPGNALTIDAVLDVRSSSFTPQELTLSAILGRAGGTRGHRPTKFAALVNGALHVLLNDNELAPIPARIPKFARRLFVVPSTEVGYHALSGVTNYVRFFSGPDVVTALPVGAALLDELALLGGVAVPPFAKYVTLQNVGGGLGGPTEALYNFELEL